MHPDAGRKRVIIEGIQPVIDAGRFPIKRTVGEQVVVEADIFTDGHDLLSAVLCYRWARDTALAMTAGKGALVCPGLDDTPTVYRPGWIILPPGMRPCASGWRQNKKCRSSY